MSQFNSEGNILLALQALQNDPELSLRRAAAIYQVHYWTLYRRQKGILSTRNTIPKSRKLSDLEEQIVIQFILDLDSRGFPPRLRGVEEMANRPRRATRRQALGFQLRQATQRAKDAFFS